MILNGLGSTYADVSQQWLITYSEQAKAIHGPLILGIHASHQQ